MLTGSEIRRKFLDFFVQKGHREVHSSSLVPANDPTLLFTNAGMNQFKDVFLGLEKRKYSKATSSQKCVRAGGKHNDLENVGFTNRHHTFFEMLGNFSFGDYFKKDAIAYAWELITSPEWYGISTDKLYVTIFDDPDKAAASWELGFDVERDREAEKYWLEAGVPQDRIFAGGRKDNFWQMGDTGPCGPCSEIHYDMGPAASDQGHTDCAFGCDCGRYVEIWNLVFMQYDRVVGGTKELPKPSIDTGMGLERVTAVLQGVISNYETDLFMPLIERASQLTGKRYFGHKDVPSVDFTAPQMMQQNASLRIIADHSRAATFLISDGIFPSNEGRGYVLRKIIRRAITHGRLLGQNEPFLYQMIFAVRNLMEAAYPELQETAERVSRVVYGEEDRFRHTVAIGLKELERIVKQPATRAKSILVDELIADRPEHRLELENAFNSARKEMDDQIFLRAVAIFAPGESYHKLKQQWAIADRLRITMLGGADAFKLNDTYGLPRDFMQDALRDQGVHLDQQGFEASLEIQRSRARASWKGAAKQTANPVYQQLPKSEFEGYRQTRSNNCEVLAIIRNGRGAQELNPGEEGEVILDHTPFYAESGGQVGDRGWLYSDDHNTVIAEVKGCYYPVQGVRAHQVVVKAPPLSQSARQERGTLRVGDKVDAVVNTDIRQSTMRNHTATHLLQAGLREVLGKHVKQAGSLVAPDHLRFDFSHFTGVEDEELRDIEDLINKEVLRNTKIEVIENVPIDVAINEYHAMALFGEKYGDRVRVIKIGDFSTELCGGTHTGQTGEIGLIKILKEGSVSSGVRRVEAVTGEGSLEHFRVDHELEEAAKRITPPEAYGTAGMYAALLSTVPRGESRPRSLKDALLHIMDTKDAEIKRLQRELERERMKIALQAAAEGKADIRLIRDVKVLATRVDNLERSQLRELADKLRTEIGSGVVVLGSATNGNVSLIVGVTKDLTSRIQAGKVIGPVAQKVGGKGGGRPDLAEAGGKDPGALDAALGEAYAVVEGLLGS
jgi:alanyl-tRNA synthetase